MRAADAVPRQGRARPPLPRRSLRRWSVRHAHGLARIYRGVAHLLRAAHPLLARLGYARLEAPVAAVEQVVKAALFDCRMCGQCVLSATGLACPTNCPKGMRNGPCGGVRADGSCEVHPGMPCVWAEAYAGALAMRAASPLGDVLPPLDHRRAGMSSWLQVARGDAAP
jgi:hypothetical protein